MSYATDRRTDRRTDRQTENYQHLLFFEGDFFIVRTQLLTQLGILLRFQIFLLHGTSIAEHYCQFEGFSA